MLASRLRSPARSTCALKKRGGEEKNDGNTAEGRTDSSLPAALGRKIRLDITSVAALQARRLSFIQKQPFVLRAAGT